MIVNIDKISSRNTITPEEKQDVEDHMDKIDITKPVFLDINLKIVKNKNQYIKSVILNKDTITIKFKLPKVLYHGTYTPKFSILNPQPEDVQQKIKGKGLYATPKLWLAVVFSKKRYIGKKYKWPWLSRFIAFSQGVSGSSIRENIEGIMDDIFSEESYIYVIDSSGFKPFEKSMLGMEFYITESKKPIKILTIEKPLKFLYDNVDRITRFNFEDRNKNNYYLITGKYCGKTRDIYKLSQKIFTDTNIFTALKTYLDTIKRKKYDPEIFRKRTAGEIIKSGFSTGCTDYALVAIALLRSKISTRYVETVQKKWLASGINNIKTSYISGHVFLDVYYKNKWLILDPFWGITSDNKYISKNEEYVVLAKGIDFEHLIGEHDFISAKNTQEIKDLAIEYFYKHKYHKYKNKYLSLKNDNTA